MRHIDLEVMDPQQCQETLKNKFPYAVENYSPNTLCGVSKNDQCLVSKINFSAISKNIIFFVYRSTMAVP